MEHLYHQQLCSVFYKKGYNTLRQRSVLERYGIIMSYEITAEISLNGVYANRMALNNE
jgi:hypothetical protein